MPTPRELQARVPQISALVPTLYSMYVNNFPETPGVHLALFADISLHATDRKECFVVRMFHRGIS
jgi:hypothetical protein